MHHCAIKLNGLKSDSRLLDKDKSLRPIIWLNHLKSGIRLLNKDENLHPSMIL